MSSMQNQCNYVDSSVDVVTEAFSISEFGHWATTHALKFCSENIMNMCELDSSV